MSSNTYAWHLIEVVGPNEHRLRDALLAANKESSWHGYVNDAAVPSITVTESKNGRAVQVERVYQTGRVLAQLKGDTILRFVNSNDQQRPLAFKQPGRPAFRFNSYRSISDEMAGRYFGVGAKAKPLPSSASDLDYAVGDRVKVIAGAFHGRTGSVKSLNFVTGEVTVSIAIFGRTQHVELYFDQVKPST